MRRKLPQKGQVVLIVLLVSMVAMTIGLSVVSRSVTDVRISAQSQEAARAFWIAQAGLEKALKIQDSLSGTTGDVNYQVTKTSLVGVGGLEYILCNKVSADEVFPVWLVGHTAAGEIDPATYYLGNSLTLYWGNQGEPADQPTTPAIAANLLYLDTAGNFRSRIYPFDPNSGRSPGTNFLSPDPGNDFSLGGSIFRFKATISNLAGLPAFFKPYLLSLKIYFANSSQPFGIRTDGSNQLPSQGSSFNAAATVSSSNITRRLTECSPWSMSAGVFDYLVFSGGRLYK